jgi:putative membrane protein
MTRIHSFAVLGATALAAASLAAQPALAGGMKADKQQHSEAVRPQALTAQNFVMYAGNADLFEIEAAKLAVERAKDPEVKQFAEHMVHQHTMSSSKITAAAQQAGLTPSTPVLTPHMRGKLTELQAASDTAFDERYMVAQVEAHERALRLHGAYARSGDNANLRTASSETAATVSQHLAEARRISAAIVADRPGGA